MTPWTRQQRNLLLAFNGIGLAVLLLAVRGSAGTDALGDQIGWLNMAVVAAVIAAGADVSWLIRGRRALLARRLRCLPHPVEAVEPDAGQPPLAAASGWEHIPGTVRAHRPGCLLTAGRPAQPIDPATARDHGLHLKRCEVCAS